MGKRGPAPEPSILKYIRGNPSKDALPASEPTPELLDNLDPPVTIADDAEAVKKWHATVPMLRRMRVFTEADVDAWALYCHTWSKWIEAKDKCRQLGRDNVQMEPDPNRTDGRMRIKWTQPYSWAVDERSLRGDLRRMQQDFGMTPSSRSQVSTTNGNADTDPVAAYAAKRRRTPGA
jgi:P27 family predicted phage terminase small subunit